MNVVSTALIFWAAVLSCFGASDLSSTELLGGGKSFCPAKTGQIHAQDLIYPSFIGSNSRAEDTGVEPATACAATDFESAC